MVAREDWEWQANLEARAREEKVRGCCRQTKEPLAALVGKVVLEG